MRIVVACAALLVAYGAVVILLPVGPLAYVALNVTAGVLLVAGARRKGYGWTTLGLSRMSVASGLRWGGAAAVIAAAGLALAPAVPFGERFLGDARATGLTGAELAFVTLVRIPIGTALFEEVAFRGVLFGMWARERSVITGVVGSSVVFGAWHVVPVLDMLRANDATGSGGLLALLLAVACAGTAAGGAVLCWLRVRTGGVWGPFVAHASVNSLATLAAWWYQRGASL